MSQRGNTPIGIFLALLALILVSVSFYQTWLGIEQLFGSASLPLAFVLSSLLLFLCYLIHTQKLKKEPVASLLMIYFFVATLCFIANFNALYTKFMKTDIYRQELSLINSNFDKLQTTVSSKFNYKYPLETAQQIEIKKKQLVEQIQDSGNPGIGDRAKALIKDLEKLLGQKITILSPLNNDYADLANRMAKQIDSMVLNLSIQENELKDEIERGVLKCNKKIQDLVVLNTSEIDTSAEKLIEEEINEYNKLGSKAQSLLGEEKFKFTPMKSETNSVGKIGYAFKHAIDNFGIYPLVVLLGCFILDFLIPILIVLIVKPNDNSQNQNFMRKTSTTVFPND